jgi:glycine cleavage system H protein
VQKALGDLVFVELPEGGTPVTAAEKFGSVESVKAVSDIISPVSGEVLEFNAALTEAPETVSQASHPCSRLLIIVHVCWDDASCFSWLWQVNSDPYEAGWLIKVKLSDKSEVDKLMGHEKYAEFQDSDHH